MVRKVFARVAVPAAGVEGNEEGSSETIVLKRKVEHLDNSDSPADTTSTLSRLAPQQPATKKKRNELASSLGIKIGKGKKPMIAAK